jgi:hypothetical protein
MSAHESDSRSGEGAASTVAGFMAAFAIFAAAAGLVYYPGRVGAAS